MHGERIKTCYKDWKNVHYYTQQSVLTDNCHIVTTILKVSLKKKGSVLHRTLFVHLELIPCSRVVGKVTVIQLVNNKKAHILWNLFITTFT